MTKLTKREPIRLGIVGSCGRGATFRGVCSDIDGITIHAVCDINEVSLAKSKKETGAIKSYLNYEEMLDKAGLDAVLISTPMHLHVDQSIAALNRNIHVLCEVTAGISTEECRKLVIAAKKSEAIYMMGENYIYTKPNQIITELVKQGLFGTPYYAEAEYLHEIKEYSTLTPWRRTWQTGIDGITYGTHSLGPILKWMPGDRVLRVCCEGSGVRHQDTLGNDYCQSGSTMLCKTEKDALIKIRVDLLSERPHTGSNYQLQGTDGCYESSRGGPWDKDKIWLRSRDPNYHWRDLSMFSDIPELTKKYLPPGWLEITNKAQQSGHGGGDYFEIFDFVRVIQGDIPNPLGIHEAMDMTLPGLISQKSIKAGGAWMEVPDSRDW
jgi:predicted dehydrogenase